MKPTRSAIDAFGQAMKAANVIPASTWNTVGYNLLAKWADGKLPEQRVEAALDALYSDACDAITTNSGCVRAAYQDVRALQIKTLRLADDGRDKTPEALLAIGAITGVLGMLSHAVGQIKYPDILRGMAEVIHSHGHAKILSAIPESDWVLLKETDVVPRKGNIAILAVCINYGLVQYRTADKTSLYKLTPIGAEVVELIGTLDK